jgi:AraC-like DNA-binding protein
MTPEADAPDPSDPPARPCYAVRVVRPFMEALRRFPNFPVAVLEPLDRLDPDERIPIATVHELLHGAIELTGDPDLGLKAAREIQPGDYGALEYVGASAETWGDAMRVIGRYMPLVNDALDYKFRVVGDRAEVRLQSHVALPRAAVDFQSAAFHVAAVYRRPARATDEVEVHFTHAVPESTAEYEKTFPYARLVFASPFNGFVLPARVLAERLPSADPKLHAVIRRHADQVLAELPRTESLTQKVRDLVTRELSGGNPGAQHVAKTLGMSARTLARKLEDEGTTFKDELDDLRRRMALQYVTTRDLGLAEIGFLLGFSQAPAFHRAFKRWTGRTPLEYRNARRG